MKNTLSKIFMFTAGAALGSVVTWKLLDEKYKKIAQEEIDSVKEYYRGRQDDDEEEQQTEPAKEKSSFGNEDRVKQANIVMREGYVDYASIHAPEKIVLPEDIDPKNERFDEEGKTVKGPYVIPPAEFGEVFEYDQYSLTYYADGVLTYEGEDEPIEDVDDLIGKGSLDTFGQYEEDSVFVRNDLERADYEILRDLRNFSDVVKKKPHSAEGR